MAKQSTWEKLDGLIERYPELAGCRDSLGQAVAALVDSYRSGGKLLVCGNGGSAADAEHIVGELMKGFLLPRPLPEADIAKLKSVCPQEASYLAANLQAALPAISLVNQIALGSAFANDQAPDLVFAQQVLGLGRTGDVLLAISTSGNSPNVLYAVQVAKAQGLVTIALTGADGGRLKELANICVLAPAKETFRIQEYHLPIYHMLCIALENEFFGA